MGAWVIHCFIRPPETRFGARLIAVAGGVIGNDASVVIAGPANTYAHYYVTMVEDSMTFNITKALRLFSDHVNLPFLRGAAKYY